MRGVHHAAIDAVVTRARWLAVPLALMALPAQAALGGPRASVERDGSHFAARMGRSTMGTVGVTTLQPTNGGIVREYSTADGTVFAVTWHGPARPDLRQLLGDRFSSLPTDAPRSGRRTGRMMRVDGAGLVVRSAGRPGAFSGVAYDPQLVPHDFAIDGLQ